jgi:hypothetical protein
MLMGLISSILGGGATGLLGVAFQRFFDFLKVKQDIELAKLNNEHARDMRKIDAELLDKEWAARTQVATIEAESRQSAAADNAFSASFAMEPKQYSAKVKVGPVAGFMLVLLDFLRGIIRPGLTVYLCAITTMVYLQARAVVEMSGATLDPAAAMSTYTMIINTILYLTTTCVLWWFGTRNRQKPPGVK